MTDTTPEVPALPEVTATPVASRTPSSASPTQAPEVAPETEKEPLPLADAVRVLIVYVRDHRTAGDSDLAAALADVEAALPVQDEQA